MVLSAITIAALAPITGALFGASYGTAIRIGYEIIFPSLFGSAKVPVSPNSTDVIRSMEKMYTNVGGLEAHKFGITQGVNLAVQQSNSPAVQELLKKNRSDTSAGTTESQKPITDALTSLTKAIELAFSGIAAGGLAGAVKISQQPSVGVTLAGDHVDENGNIRNETLMSLSDSKINDMLRLVNNNQIPINWPSNWNKLIPDEARIRADARISEKRTASTTAPSTNVGATVTGTYTVTSPGEAAHQTAQTLGATLLEQRTILKRYENTATQYELQIAKQVSENRALAKYYGANWANTTQGKTAVNKFNYIYSEQQKNLTRLKAQKLSVSLAQKAYDDFQFNRFN